MSKDICKQIGRRLKKFRLAKGYTQESLALDIGVDKSYIGKVENANICVGIRTLEKLSQALEVEIADFFIKNLK